MRTSHDGGRRFVIAAALVAAFAVGGCASVEPAPQVMTWRAVTKPVSIDRATGVFVRRGLATFADGEVALQTVEGQMQNPQGTEWRVRISYLFEDESTFVHEGQGRLEQRDGRTYNVGAGAIMRGTGRFAGITGTTSAIGRNVFETEQFIDYRGEYRLPRR